MAIQKEHVKWKDIFDYVSKVAELYKNANITGVFGIPRGGLIYAVLLSHLLDIPLLLAPIKNCIIIDDIADTGETLIHYQNDSSGTKTNKYHITTMYWKEGSMVKPEFYYKEKKDKWIVFPWEKED